MWVAIKYLIKTSRPGLWFPTLWLYLLPASIDNLIQSPLDFWMGFIYFTFPFNLLIYGWNDMADREIDVHNLRKDSFLFGALFKPQYRQLLIITMVLVQLPFLVYFISAIGMKVVLWFSAGVIFNVLYNHPKIKLSGRPPFDVIIQVAYLLPFVLSMWLNYQGTVSWQTFLYLCLFAIQAHLIGEIMDITSDRKAGRRTVAVILGNIKSKWLLLGIVILESGLLLLHFSDLFLGLMLLSYAIFLLADALFIFKDKTYPLKYIYLFGLLANIMGYVTMIWLWYNNSLIPL